MSRSMLVCCANTRLAMGTDVILSWCIKMLMAYFNILPCCATTRAILFEYDYMKMKGLT